MKNLKKILLIVVATGLIFSCTKDNLDDSDITVESLLGAWKLTASLQNDIPLELTECDLSDLIIFDKAKLMHVFNKDGNSGANCSILTLKKGYTVRDNIITEDDGTEITILQLQTFEPSSLVLEFEETYDDEKVIYKETYVKRQ